MEKGRRKVAGHELVMGGVQGAAMLVGVRRVIGGRPAGAGASSKGRGGVGEGERDRGRATVVRLAGSWLSKMQVRDKTSVLEEHTRSRARQVVVCYGCSETSNSARWTPSGGGGLKGERFLQVDDPDLKLVHYRKHTPRNAG